MNFSKLLPSHLWQTFDAIKRLRPFAERECPICGYCGFFQNFGRPPRIDARCPSCKSLERHRLFWLWYAKNNPILHPPILHFAPEKVLEAQFRKRHESQNGSYLTADLFSTSDLKINIEDMNLPDGSFSTVICNHVLEHVDDKKAFAELNRILSNDGILIVSVPIVEGWDKTYENSSVTTPVERDLHFGQMDHVRYYGNDFRDRLTEAGFRYSEITAEGSDVIKHALLRGEKFFVCRKRGRLTD